RGLDRLRGCASVLGHGGLLQLTAATATTSPNRSLMRLLFDRRATRNRRSAHIATETTSRTVSAAVETGANGRPSERMGIGNRAVAAVCGTESQGKANASARR